MPGILSSTGRLSVLQISSFIRHLLHWKRHPYLIWGSCYWGFTGSRRYHFISDSALDPCIPSQEQSSQLISGKCSFYLTNPNPNFCYKIGIFAWQFACPVVSAYLLRNRKYRDLRYYNVGGWKPTNHPLYRMPSVEPKIYKIQFPRTIFWWRKNSQ